MLLVKGILKLSGGSLGETTFMKVNGKNTAREKMDVNPKRFARDRTYVRVRENAKDFGRGSKSARAIRTAFSSIIPIGGDKKLSTRLHHEISNVFKTDTVSIRGESNIKTGDITLLNGFNFNINARLRAAFNVGFTTEMNITSGEFTINIPSFRPTSAMRPPEGTTHYKIISGAAAIDFTSKQYTTTTKFTESPVLPFDNNDTSAITALHSVPVGAQDSVLMVLGIEFYQSAGKWMDSVKRGKGDCLAIVAVG